MINIIFKNGPLDGRSISINEANKYILNMNEREYTYINTGKKDILDRTIFEIKNELNKNKLN